MFTLMFANILREQRHALVCHSKGDNSYSGELFQPPEVSKQTYSSNRQVQIVVLSWVALVLGDLLDTLDHTSKMDGAPKRTSTSLQISTKRNGKKKKKDLGVYLSRTGKFTYFFLIAQIASHLTITLPFFEKFSYLPLLPEFSDLIW